MGSMKRANRRIFCEAKRTKQTGESAGISWAWRAETRAPLFWGGFHKSRSICCVCLFFANSSRRFHFPRFSFLPVRALTFRTRDANSPPLPFAWHYQTQPATDSNWRQQLESKAKRKICPDWRLIVLTGCEAAGVADFLFQFTRITDWSRRCVCVCECFQGRLESALFFFSETVISVSQIVVCLSCLSLFILVSSSSLAVLPFLSIWHDMKTSVL